MHQQTKELCSEVAGGNFLGSASLLITKLRDFNTFVSLLFTQNGRLSPLLAGSHAVHRECTRFTSKCLQPLTLVTATGNVFLNKCVFHA